MKVLITGDTSVLVGNAIQRQLKDSDIDIVICDGITPPRKKVITAFCGHPLANLGINITEPVFPTPKELEEWQSSGKRKMPKLK